MIKLFLPVLVLIFSFNNNVYAQSKEQVQTAAKAADAMSQALTKLDEVNKAKDAIQSVSKLAKAAKAFGAASVALNIGISLFGGDDENIRLLKQITKMVSEVKAKLDKLEVEVKSGFEKLEDANEYRSAQNQVFESISHINSGMLKIQYYLNTMSETDMEEAAADILRFNVAQLGTDMQNILRSCTGANGTLSSNLLDASLIKSNANMDFVKGIGTQLLSAVSSAAYVESIYSQLSFPNDPAKQDAARRRVASEYGKYIDQIETAVNATLTRCADFNVIRKYSKRALDRAIEQHKNETSPDLVAARIRDDFMKAWPNTEIIATAYRNSKVHQYDYWNNFSDHGVPIIQMEWKTSQFHGVIWIIPHDSFMNQASRWDTYLSTRGDAQKFLGDAANAYWKYYWANNLHRYISDGGDRPFGPYPFCFTARRTDMGEPAPAVVNAIGIRSNNVDHIAVKDVVWRMGIDIFTPTRRFDYNNN